MQAKWKKLVFGSGMDGSKPLPPLPSRLVTDDDLKDFYEAMKLYDVQKTGAQPNVGVKRKGESLGALDTQHYGRGKRAREVCCLLPLSYFIHTHIYIAFLLVAAAS